MASEHLRSIGSTGFDHTGGSAFTPQAGGGRSTAEPEIAKKQEDDQVQLSCPQELTLRLLRERILEHSRVQLQLARPQISFAVVPPTSNEGSMERYVGRLISDQNLLAAVRRGDWPDAQIDAAIEDGMTTGLEETLQVLFELDQLTEESWGQIRGFLAEFHRKVESALPKG